MEDIVKERKENKVKKGIEKALWSKHSVDKIYYYYSNTFYHSSVPFSGRRCQLGRNNRCKAGSLYNVDSCLTGSELQPSNEFQLECSVLSLKYQTPLWFSQLCTSSRQSLLHCCRSKQAAPRPTPLLWLVHCSQTKQIQGGKYKHYRVSVEWLYKGMCQPLPPQLLPSNKRNSGI